MTAPPPSPATGRAPDYAARARVAGLLALAALAAGCATQSKQTPLRFEPLAAALPESCAPGPGGADAGPVIPGGLAVVLSEGREVAVVAARGCLLTIDVGTGAVAPLPTRGDSIAPTMVSATGEGLAVSSSLSGTVRSIDAAGAVAFNVSGLRHPLGLRLLPGGSVVVAEFGAGRILRLGPLEDSRPRVVAENLAGPVGLVVVDANSGYVTEHAAGRVTRFRLDRLEVIPVARGLDHPEGIAMLADGRLAVAEVGRRRIVAIEPRTGQLTVLADKLPIGLPDPAAGEDPYAVTDVAAGSDGTLFVSGDLERSVYRLVPRRPAAR